MADDLVTRISVQGVPAVVSSLQQLAAAYKKLDSLANSNPVTAAAWRASKEQLGFTGQAATRAAQQFQQAAPKVGMLTRAHHELTLSMNSMRLHASSYVAAMERPFKALGAILPGIGREVKSLFGSISSSFKWMALGGGIAIEQFLQRNVSLVAARQQTEIGFKTMLGSANAAKQLLAQNQQWANYSPWGIDEANNLASALLIAQVPAENLKRVMNDVGNAVAAVGGNAETLSRVGFNFQEIAGKGQIDAMDIRQFAAAHIDALGAMAQALNMTPDALKDMMGQDGGNRAVYKKIGGVEGLAAALGARYPQAMVEQSKTLLGLWSTLKDKMNEGIVKGMGPLIPLLSQYIKNLEPIVTEGARVFAIGANWMVDKLPRAVNALRPALTWVTSALASMLDFGKRNWDTITGAAHNLGRVLKGLGTIIANIFSGPVMTFFSAFLAPAALAALSAFATAIDLIARHSKGLTAALTALIPLMVGGTLVRSPKITESWAGRKVAGAVTGGVAQHFIGGAAAAAVGAALFPVIGPLSIIPSLLVNWGIGKVAGDFGSKHPTLILAGIGAAISGAIIGVRKLYHDSKGFRDIVQSLRSIFDQLSRLVVSVFGPVLTVIGRVLRGIFTGIKVVFTVQVLWPFMIALRAIGLGMRALAGYIRLSLAPINLLIHLVQRLVSWIGRIHWPSPPRWARDILGAPSAVFRQGQRALGAVGRFLGDEGAPRMFAGSASFHGAISGRSPGSQMVTSGYRTSMLGSANSDHLRGAYDVAGSGLGGYAAAVNASGGYAAMHGGGSHLHVVPPMGDSGSPRGGGSFTGGTGNHYTLQIFPATAMDMRKEVRQMINEIERDDIERLKLKSNRRIQKVG